MSIFEEGDHRLSAMNLAEEAVKVVGQGDIDFQARGQVYATAAVAEANLAVYDILIDIRDKLESINNQLRHQSNPSG